MKYWCSFCEVAFDRTYEGRCPYCDDPYGIVTSMFEGASVQLKSGGPVMTIQKINGNMAECIWFDNSNDLKTIKLSLNVLTFANNSEINDDSEDDYDYDDSEDDYDNYGDY